MIDTTLKVGGLGDRDLWLNTVAEQFWAVSKIQKALRMISSVIPCFSLASLWVENRSQNLSQLEDPEGMNAARE
jgi:hypothetical protein